MSARFLKQLRYRITSGSLFGNDILNLKSA
jgi:hypothetical protein